MAMTDQRDGRISMQYTLDTEDKIEEKVSSCQHHRRYNTTSHEGLPGKQTRDYI